MNDKSGLLLIDKPADWTSNDVCQFVKRRFRFKKVGHTGTLDPAATGVMILLINRMTKMAFQFSGDRKTYRAKIQFGLKTTTADLEGETLEESAIPDISIEDLDGLVNSFSGSFEQTPPMYSAKKVDGIRLYKLARAGKEITREPIIVDVSDFLIHSWEKPVLDLSLNVSKGFYVRSFAEQIGEYFNSLATLAELRRTEAGSYSIDACVSIEKLRSLKNAEDITSYLLQPNPEGLIAQENNA